MKTKNVLKSLLTLLLIATVQSCNVEQNPKLWKVEIEDAFKFQMAQAMAYTAVAFMELDNDEVDATVNAVIKSADAMAEKHYSKGESNVARYYLALKEYSQKDAQENLKTFCIFIELFLAESDIFCTFAAKNKF